MGERKTDAWRESPECPKLIKHNSKDTLCICSDHGTDLKLSEFQDIHLWGKTVGLETDSYKEMEEGTSREVKATGSSDHSLSFADNLREKKG